MSKISIAFFAHYDTPGSVNWYKVEEFIWELTFSILLDCGYLKLLFSGFTEGVGNASVYKMYACDGDAFF